MFSRNGGAWKKATSTVQASVRREKSAPRYTADYRPLSTVENGASSGRMSAGPPRNHPPSSAEVKQKRESDRQFLISVLESSATKRDAKAYLQTFGSSRTGSGPRKTPAFTTVLYDGIRGANEVPRFVQGPMRVSAADSSEVPHVAIVKLREPQTWDDALLDGVAKTLTQLRDLGLGSVIVVDCDPNQSAGSAWRKDVDRQTDRILRTIGRYGSPGAELVGSGIWKIDGSPQKLSSVGSTNLFVGFGQAFTTPLRHGHMLVVPPYALSEETLGYMAADANEIVSALTYFFSGLQFDQHAPTTEMPKPGADGRPVRTAVVDRIIVIDPFGGIPSSNQVDGARVFVNLEEEFATVQGVLAAKEHSEQMRTISGFSGDIKAKHAENLKLVRNTLAVLPSTASAVITSPAEAANVRVPPTQANGANVGEFAGEVKTRRWQNPLIHNLLTDRPIYSASLPIGRVKPATHGTQLTLPRMPTTTLAKKGLPVTIFPDPRAGVWMPPDPGAPRLRLTDKCIDLPRLVHLINDSFNRKLDVEHYLRRVKDSLAGIIIAGEYEGGAILTWERPFGMDEEEAYKAGRLVPYLDKFAVLKKSQGAGGVADIVFNAMVRDCFPSGVCWRSRKNNPVNKWYFERSCGVRKLPDSNWAMFWTNPSAATSEQLMRDYENVCRSVVPSWADTKPAD
ncbi:Amino-acid acetyltransferase, mitochondrial [Madurella fahalii]|uniref:Amino-acid acetyltransferase, mitochondrial n=1 Tax=Madurella fahalii TaxID=1157608 RepID=A0ABQ0GMH5_9PEZI